jgi:hypothetical protein
MEMLPEMGPAVLIRIGSPGRQTGFTPRLAGGVASARTSSLGQF